MPRQVISKTHGEDYENFGKMLSNKREELGISQADAANRLNIPQSTYAGYETGTRKVPLSLIKKLASFYSTSVDELLQTSKQKLERDSDKILIHYNKLNSLGKSEAEKRVYELTQIKEYINAASETAEELIPYEDIIKMNLPMAAHENEDATEKMKERDLNKALKLLRKDKT